MYTTFDILDQHCTRSALLDKIAVIDGERRATYAELLERAWSYGGFLKDLGLRKGDRVGIFLPRSFEAVISLFAVHFAGGVAVMLNERLRTGQVQYILDHSQASFLITDGRQLLQVPGLQFPENCTINLDDVEPPQTAHSSERTIGADLALIIYTSGSTGLPKGVMLSHDNLISGARIVADYLNLAETDRIISLLPFSFDYGLNQLLTAVLMGATLLIQRSLLPADICRTLEKESVTGMAAVPTLWLQLAQRHSPFTRMSFPSLRYITNSGGRLPEQLVRLIRKAHPEVQIYLMYGLTEAFRSTYLPPDQVDSRPCSIGKAIPNVEILVINEQGMPCKAGEVGELVHRGANISMGYWRDPEATMRIFRPHPLQRSEQGHTETVVFSGDLVRTDADGYLYFVGRKDQQIKSSGFRVSPEEIERCIFGSQLVSNVVAFAIPRDEVDNDIAVAIIPRDAGNSCQKALREFCKREMPEYMRPRIIWQLDQFPLTGSGKPDRVKIREQYVETDRRAANLVGTPGTA